MSNLYPASEDLHKEYYINYMFDEPIRYSTEFKKWEESGKQNNRQGSQNKNLP